MIIKCIKELLTYCTAHSSLKHQNCQIIEDKLTSFHNSTEQKKESRYLNISEWMDFFCWLLWYFLQFWFSTERMLHMYHFCIRYQRFCVSKLFPQCFAISPRSGKFYRKLTFEAPSRVKWRKSREIEELSWINWMKLLLKLLGRNVLREDESLIFD